MRKRKERDRFRLSSAVPKIQLDSNPTAPTAIRQWETFSSVILTKETSICITWMQFYEALIEDQVFAVK